MRPTVLLLLGACGAAAPRVPAASGGSTTVAVNAPAPVTPLLQSLWAENAAVIVFCADAVLPSLERHLGEFEAAGAWVAAVSSVPADEVRQLTIDQKLSFPVLSDPSGELARVWHACEAGRATGFVVEVGGRILYRGGADVTDLLAAVRK